MIVRKANFHIHTYYSDGVYTPRQILRFAKKKEFSAITVTDHNEIRGTLKVFDLAPEYEIIAYLGAELFFQVKGKLTEMLVYFTEKNDIVAFMNEFRSEEFYPKFDKIDELLGMVKRHHGLAIAPHPYGHKGILGHDVEPDLCGIEVANSFITKADNRRAREYVAKNKGEYKEFGGADMHIFPYSFDCAHTLLKSEGVIDFDTLWSNMKGESNGITFTAVGGSLPLSARIIQELWCLIKASIYLALQNRTFTKLHNFHNFHSHHTKWDRENNS
jgi:hypothetical protein